MKKINQLYFLFLIVVGVALAFSSCKEQDLSYESGNAFYFRPTDNVGTVVVAKEVSEDLSSPVAIPIVFTKTSPIAGSVTVEITSDDAVLNVDYAVLTSNLTFDFTSNQYRDTLYIQPLPNEDENEDRTINIVMVSGTASLGFVGLEGGTSLDSTTVILLNNDVDCPVPAANLAGTYSVTTTYGFHDFIADEYAENTMTMELADNGDGTYTPEDFSGGLYGSGPYVAAYGTTALADVIFAAEVSGEVTWTGASDPWGAVVPTAGGINAVDDCGIITISWTAEGYGENGVSVYTRL